MAALLSKYDSSQFAIIVDYIVKATEALAKQTTKLRDEGRRRKE